MKKGHLPQASLAPFGTFEIEISEIFAEQRRRRRRMLSGSQPTKRLIGQPTTVARPASLCYFFSALVSS
jgi:hypothetical protein